MNTTTTIKDWLDRVFGRRRRLRCDRAVLLTFDDGPDSVVTPAVLERLKRYQARAVFFVVGSRINKARDVLSQILAAGHALGNHTYAHRLDRDPWLISYCIDVRRCQRLVTRVTGQAPRFFRAPMGRYSAGALLAPRMLGLDHLLWSTDSHDWKLRGEEAAKTCANRLCADVRPGDIVLLHDDNPWVLTVLDILLPTLASRGIDLCSGVNGL